MCLIEDFASWLRVCLWGVCDAAYIKRINMLPNQCVTERFEEMEARFVVRCVSENLFFYAVLMSHISLDEKSGSNQCRFNS